MLGAFPSWVCATGWVGVFGGCRRASAADLFLAACLTLRSLKGLAVPFGFDFLSGAVDRAVVVLAVAVVLVSFDGAPYLVELGHVAKLGFRRFSLKLCRVGFLCLVFLINRTRVSSLYRFSVGFPYKPAKFPSS